MSVINVGTFSQDLTSRIILENLHCCNKNGAVMVHFGSYRWDSKGGGTWQGKRGKSRKGIHKRRNERKFVAMDCG